MTEQEAREARVLALARLLEGLDCDLWISCRPGESPGCSMVFRAGNEAGSAITFKGTPLQALTKVLALGEPK